MQDWPKNKSILYSRVGVVLFALALAALDVGGYPIVRWFGGQRHLPWQNSAGILGVLYACSVFGWILLWAMWKLLGNLHRGLVFTEDNLRLLRRISLCCAAAAVLCAAGCVFYLPLLIPVLAAGFMALIVSIVRSVFRTALEMKHELDLTV